MNHDPRQQAREKSKGTDSSSMQYIDGQREIQRAKDNPTAQGPGFCVEGDAAKGVGVGAQLCHGVNWASESVRGHVGSALQAKVSMVNKAPSQGWSVKYTREMQMGTAKTSAEAKVSRSDAGDVSGSVGGDAKVLMGQSLGGSVKGDRNRVSEVSGTYGTPGGVKGTVGYDVRNEQFKGNASAKIADAGIGGKNTVTVERTWVQVSPPTPEQQAKHLDGVRQRENGQQEAMKKSAATEDPGALPMSAMRNRADILAREAGVDTRTAEYRSHGWQIYAGQAGYSSADLAGARNDSRDLATEKSRRMKDGDLKGSKTQARNEARAVKKQQNKQQAVKKQQAAKKAAKPAPVFAAGLD